MLNNKKSKIISYKNTSKRSTIMAISSVLVFTAFVVQPLVRADQYEEQIQQIQNDTAKKQSAVEVLQAQSSSYQEVITKLQDQIVGLQSQINSNTTKRDDLQQQISAAQLELDKQKDLLGQNIKAMYVEGEISTLEMLASSKDLSEFLDKQQYRTSVQEKIKSNLTKVNELKSQLREQKTLVEKLLNDQQLMQNDLFASREEQNKLLSYTEDQKAQFNSQIASNNSQISELRAQQAAANSNLGGRAVSGDPNKGGYPAYLDNVPQDALIDPWGMFNRQCVSYTAWKVYQTYGHMPYWGGHGNANQWPASAIADGIPTGSTPRKGSVAVSMSGYYGHVMWVEDVYPDGRIRVSQYNYDWAGNYSEMTISGSGLIYIYFN